MKSPWVFVPKAKRYRNTKTGRWIGPAQQLVLKDAFLAAQRDKMDALAAKLGRDAMTRREWVLATREVIKGTYLDLYALSKGGRGHMTQSDFGRLGAMIKQQYAALNQFEAAIRDGKMSQAQIAYRAKLYVNSAKQAFERGKVASYGVPDLPAMPGDGTSECRTNCKCEWKITETDTEWLCTWQRNVAESCPTCEQRARMWNPLRIPKVPARLSARQGDVLWAAML